MPRASALQVLAAVVCAASCSSADEDGGGSTAGVPVAGTFAGRSGMPEAGGSPPAGGMSGVGGAPVTGDAGGGGTPSAIAGGDATGGAEVGGGGGAAGEAGAAGESGSGGAESVGAGAGGSDIAQLEPFSFFVTSMEAIIRLSGNDEGFGGDLRYGEETGLAGADKICSEIADSSMPGASAKVWRAFLSTAAGGPDGGPVHAIDRVGEGPWYDRLGRLVAMTRDDLLYDRPQGADPAIINDLPNELGVPNHAPDGVTEVDNHHTMTGSGEDGRLHADGVIATCQDWTSSEGAAGRPRMGFSWPRPGSLGGRGGSNWISGYSMPGCAPDINIVQTGPPPPGTMGVGSGGGYGGFYCFALSP